MSDGKVEPAWRLIRRRRQRRLDLIHAKLHALCDETLRLYGGPIMPSRLTEKLSRVAEVHKRMHDALEARADAFIDQEPAFVKKIEDAFAPREADMAAKEADIASLMKDLTELSNRPPDGGTK